MSNSCGNMIPTMCGGSMIPAFVTNEIGVACETVLTCEDALGVVCQSQVACNKADVSCVAEKDDMLPTMNCVDTELHTTC